MLKDLKIGFLYNHDELHQVAHTAPIISKLQQNCPDLQVDVITSSKAQADAVARQLDPNVAPPNFISLKRHRAYNLAEKASGNVVPLNRIGCLAANLDLLASYDALIVPETTSTLLKSRFKLLNTKLIFYPHGAGDRSISVSPEMALFDFVLLPGEKTRDRMLAQNIIRSDNHAIVGYPKFDSRLVERPVPLFANDRPTVLYNPHFDPMLSSWFSFGMPLLEYFAGQQSYNLILAPHVMLFKRKILASVEHRKFRLRKAIPECFSKMDHIHIDTGSISSVDMSYTRMADIYLGDVSSQIYEFIETPRPAIFLNSHQAKWQGNANYAFWEFGPVVDTMRDFDTALTGSIPLKDQFRSRQEAAFIQTFGENTEHRPAVRAAHAITTFLQRQFAGRSDDA